MNTFFLNVILKEENMAVVEKTVDILGDDGVCKFIIERKLTEEYDKSTGVERATLKMVFEMFSACGL